MAKNYIIENGGLNFYEELYKSLDQPIETSDLDLCLITSSPLTENWVQLECNHKFNYVPLYNDILNHKKTFNRLERRVLKAGEIRCPYCRNIQSTLLPYYEIVGINQVHGVNCFDESQEKLQNANIDDYIKGKCAYIMNYTSVGKDGTKIVKTTKCTNINVKLLELDGKTYCIQHKYYAVKDHAKMEKLKTKEIKDAAKEKAKLEKEQAKLEKEQAKEQAKQAKEQAKQEKQKMKPEKKMQSENIIIQNVDVEKIGGCVEILKSGFKKGSLCGCKVKQDSLCGRHSK
uniref:Uncharacterized protein n=1 Tax=viral metagenome TaxID=1070528 RepID=A0A6C0B9Z8_9ZZZZ